jgi:transcriptional regulator with XRE-family HTH domain
MTPATSRFRSTTALGFIGLTASIAVLVAMAPGSGPFPTRLGDHLKASRKATGLSLRGVEARTQITNGYLSQIESNTVDRPSPNVLFKLSEVYGIDYNDLMRRAGHHVATAGNEDRPTALAGIPLRALEELSEPEAAELRNYLAFIQQKRTG